tara:strand:- start:6312 stop:6776 length:465 start_codon:yes stop_codon:yes gene_type:complete
MSFFELLESSPKIFGIIGIVLLIATLISFLINFSLKFRLTGATIFSFLLSLSSWAFLQSYSENIKIEGSKYVPIVYDNGYDLIVAKANIDFPESSINPTLAQITANLKKGSRSGKNVLIRIRTLERISEEVSKPIILGQVEKNFITSQRTDETN